MFAQVLMFAQTRVCVPCGSTAVAVHTRACVRVCVCVCIYSAHMSRDTAIRTVISGGAYTQFCQPYFLIDCGLLNVHHYKSG